MLVKHRVPEFIVSLQTKLELAVGWVGIATEDPVWVLNKSIDLQV
jgi:hypothetical protein